MSETPNMPEFKGGHKIITWAAIQCLPQWQQEYWRENAYDLSNEYSLYGDTYYTNVEQLGPYVELPDGKAPCCQIGVLRYKNHICAATDFWESPFYDHCTRVLTYYMARIVENLASGALNEAARFAGSAAHYIEDSGVPAHAADNGDMEFVKDYMPAPEGFAMFPIHSYTERSPDNFLLDDYTPRLYGLTNEEVGANYLERYIELVIYARSLLFPLVKCAYENDDAKAQQLRNLAARKCGDVFADYLYTATCIAAGRFDEAEKAALQTVSLARRWPYRMTAWAPAPYFEPGPLRLAGINLDMDRNPVPCRLKMADGAIKETPDALGAGGRFIYHYHFPEGIYETFSALVGPHADLGVHCALEIEVIADEETVFSGVLQPDGPPLDISADISGCRDLILRTAGPEWPSPAAANIHVVWAKPTVLKKSP